MDDFEMLFCECRSVVERFVRFKLPSVFDAEDVLQEVYIAANIQFKFLKDKTAFKAWILGIARHKCADYYRKRAKSLEIPLEEISETKFSYGRLGITETEIVRETLSQLADTDKQLLYLYYFREWPQAKIASEFKIPLGTVKSRLHKAKLNFKNHYPYPPKIKGENTMKKLPKIMPAYTIEKTSTPVFRVKWEELIGWCIVPKLGEKLSWGLYDSASGKQTEYTTMEVTGKAEIHGLEGVEIIAVQHNAEDYYRTGSIDRMERKFVAQLTDTHCRYLAESHMENGIRKCYTFLDGDSFLNNWGFGDENCGTETTILPKGLLTKEGSNIIGPVTQEELMDVVGSYKVTINGRAFDTLCVFDLGTFNDAVASETYLDKNGRTILWRRFNRDDWALDKFKKRWSEQLPENEKLIVNGEIYVHWYDCITDYIF